MANTHSLDLELSSSQYAYITNAGQTGLNVSGDFTIECWIKLEQLPSAVGSVFTLVAKDGVSAGNRAYLFQINNSDNKAQVLFWDASGNLSRFTMDTAFGAGDVGQWRHIAVAVDVSGPSAEFYKDSSPITDTANNTAATSVDNNTATKFAIGARDNLNIASIDQYYDGLIDDVRVWSDIRSSGEISTYYNRELNGTEANLVGYWKLDNSYLDATSNNNDLTAVNTPVFSTDVPTFVTATFVPKVMILV